MPPLPGVEYRGIGFSQPNTPRISTDSIGSGLQQVGAAFKDVAGVLDALAQDDGRLYAEKVITQERIKSREDQLLAETSGEDLTGVTQRLADASTARWNDAYEKAPNHYAQRFLDQAREQTLGDVRYNAMGLEAKFQAVKRIDGVKDIINLKANEVFANPEMFPQARAEIEHLLETTAGIPFESRADLENQMGVLATSAISGMIERNPYAAANQLESGQWDKYLDPNDRVSLYNGAQAGIRSREAEAKQRANEAKAAQAEAARVALEGADDALAFVAAGNVPTPEILTNYSPERILALTGSEKAAKKAADAFARGEGVRELLNAGTPAERAKVIEDWRAKAADPENYQFNQDTLRILESGAADLNDKLVKDPGGVAQMSTRVQDAIATGSGVNIVAASYAEQERQGIPDFQRKPLSKAYAAQVAEQISTLPPDQQAGAMQELAKSYGSYWPDVLKQIGDKLPSGLAIAAVMPPGRAATRVAETAGLKMDEVMVGLDKDASRNIDDAITNDERFSNLASVLGSQVGGQKTLSQYSDAIKRSTAIIMRESGASEADAVAQATAEITADIDFRSVGQGVVAIPTASNPDMVEAGLDALTANFDLTDVDLPPSATGMNEADVKAAYASSIRRNGQWVPDGSGKGVYLYVEGDPVTRGGAPVLFTWDDLKAAGLPKDGFMFEGQR